ncbi:hypothetical protein [Paenibacillus chibensis]|uniref:hypothetical protein n=1 Tax=Paenibacillus chibensis TaxID=59846 RepID=UPI000FD83E1F|nr:hypothetical protein [Paenibacillus chibensis]MEC0369332.1 hypothetical protein [Paenibacillus chibensis]
MIESKKLSKTVNQFHEVIKQSKESIGRCVSLIINNDNGNALLNGLSIEQVIPRSAIAVIRQNKQSFVKGYFDELYFEFSSSEDLNPSSPLLIGIDCRIKDNTRIYYKSEATIGKVSSSTKLNMEDYIYIFWEYGSNACLTICSYDPIQDQVIRETVSANNEPMKRFLKTVVRQALPPYEEQNLVNEQSLEEDSEEILDYEAEWN